MTLRILFAIFFACGCGTADRHFVPFDSDGGGTDAGTFDGSTETGAGTTTDGGACGAEVCGNGLDDDCDGAIDDECGCIPGEMQPCYDGPISVRGVGACMDGTQTRDDSGESGSWGECAGSVLPGEEICDEGGADENRDGAVNEGCGCDPSMGPIACGDDTGACAPGVQECIDGMLGDCPGAIGPSAETCNGLDDAASV